MTVAGTHHEHEDDPWTIDVGDHAARTDTPQYRRSRTLMVDLVKTCQPWWFGDKPYQDHHGGGIWLKDDSGWFMVFGPAGIEWSAQFCADPAKVDLLRQFTKRLVDRFPDTVPGYEQLGYHDATPLLTTPITDADGISAWTDGILNASVPLSADLHIGVLPKAAGYHHYPKPIVDILDFKHDDFELFVKDADGSTAAVLPVGRRGSGDGRVAVAWAPEGSELGRQLAEHEATGRRLLLPAQNPLARAAFIRQA